MKYKLKQMSFFALILTNLIIAENQVVAGSGAAWGGLAGGIIVGSAIANSNRNRDVVYVNNDNPPHHYSHREQRKLNQQQAELNRQRAELNRERARLNRQAAQLGYLD